MNFIVTINEATEELGISAAELLRAVMERRIPRPGKFFGWPCAPKSDEARSHQHKRSNGGNMSDIEEDSSAVSRRLQQAYLEEYGPDQKTDDEGSGPGARESRNLLPPADMSARQKLEWANANAAPVGRTAKPPVTLDEIGMSPAELARLRPEQRLARVNEAMARRKTR